MNRRTSPWTRIVLAAVVATAASAAAAQQVVLDPNLGAIAGVGTKPSARYDLALATLAEGGFADALAAAVAEYETCWKFGNERWFDSIAAAALVGECQFELGDFPRAVACYDEALALAAQHPKLLIDAQFPDQQPRAVAGRRAATWGRSERRTSPAQLPVEVPVRLQANDPNQVVQKGGVLNQANDQSLRVQEIMRGLTIALYRRGDILGELGREAATLNAVANSLAQRPARPNHYSQAWIDVALGTALWSQGKPDPAKQLLVRGLTCGQNLDHQLTAWGLIVLGRIALDDDRTAEAAKLFEEATYAAADFGDARALEEGFRLAFAAHMLTNARVMPATIRAASDAIGPRDGLGVLRARLLAMRAEALATAGESRGATAAVKEIDQRPLRGSAAAEAAYADALAALAEGNLKDGDAHLVRALGLARLRSTRLFQTNMLVGLVNGNAGLPDRKAEELFGRLLAPPTPRDFGLDPLGTLAVITTPRRQAFEAWFTVVTRGGLAQPKEAVFDVAEATRREHWTASRPVGGRLQAVERLLAADPNGLDPALAARRAAILAARPDLGRLLDSLGRQRAELATAARDAGRPADNAPPREPAGAAKTWAGYLHDAGLVERHAATLATGRGAVTIDFPPLTPAAEIRRRLPKRQVILSFHWTERGLTGALESRDKFMIWDVRRFAGLPAEIAQLARGLCLFDAQGVVGTDKLKASDWRGPATRIERMLFENSRVNLAEGIDELVIVPDGWLWYVPFELLPISTARAGAADDDKRPLGELCRIRYCPTRSLAVAGFPAARAQGLVGIHAGHMNRGDDDAAVLPRVGAAVDGAVPLVVAERGPPPALVASVFDAVALFDESGGPNAVLVPPVAGRGGLSLADWLAPPPKRPRVVLVPGFQTAMADGLKDPKALPARPGDDVFLPATDLLAAGARTAVISRWRVGGGTCIDLMAEFLRDATAPAEVPEPAAESWRRAVDLVTAARPDPQREPRLRQHGDDGLPDGRHPFLWAGYLLVDCGSGNVPAAVAAAPPPPGGAAAPAGAAPAGAALPVARPAAGAAP